MGKKSTTTTSNEPPDWAKPLFTKSAGVAEDLYDSGSGFSVWEGDTIAAPSVGTKQGTQGLLEAARDPMLSSLVGGAQQGADQLFSSGGYNGATQGAANLYGGVSQGAFDAYNPFSSLAPAGRQVDGANDIFHQGAQGDFNTNLDIFRRINPVTAAQQDARSLFRRTASGGLEVNPNLATRTGGRNNLMNDAALLYRDMPSLQNLQSMAAGEHIGGNEYENEAIRQAATDLADQVSMQFSGAGRYGSGSHQDTVIDSTGDFLNKALGDQFNRDRALQMQANQMLDASQLASAQGLQGLGTSIRDFKQAQNMAKAGLKRDNNMLRLSGGDRLASLGSTLFGQRLGQASSISDAKARNAGLQYSGAGSLLDNAYRGATGATGIDSSNMDRRLAGVGGLQGAGQSALDTQRGYMDALPTLLEGSLFAPTTSLQGGAIQDQYNQSLLTDDIRRFYENDMNEWTRLGALQAAAGGAAGPYGTSVQTTRQPFNPFSMLGGLFSLFG